MSFGKLQCATMQKAAAKAQSSKNLKVTLLRNNGFVKTVVVTGDVFGAGTAVSLELFGEVLPLVNRSIKFVCEDIKKVRPFNH